MSEREEPSTLVSTSGSGVSALELASAESSLARQSPSAPRSRPSPSAPQGLPAVLPPLAAQLDLTRRSVPPDPRPLPSEPTRPSFHGRRPSDPTPQPARVSLAPLAPITAPAEFPAFARALYAAGLLSELRVEHLPNLPALTDSTTPRERLDFLEAYYAAGDDPVVSLRRRAADRWFLYDNHQGLAGAQLVQRLTFVLPELAQAHLERVGGRNGTLLLRAADLVCALDDDQADRSGATIAIDELVRGMNMLMERRGEHVRLVGLVGDGSREAYVGVAAHAYGLALCEQDLLSPCDAESLSHLTGW